MSGLFRVCRNRAGSVVITKDGEGHEVAELLTEVNSWRMNVNSEVGLLDLLSRVETELAGRYTMDRVINVAAVVANCYLYLISDVEAFIEEVREAFGFRFVGNSYEGIKPQTQWKDSVMFLHGV